MMVSLGKQPRLRVTRIFLYIYPKILLLRNPVCSPFTVANTRLSVITQVSILICSIQLAGSNQDPLGFSKTLGPSMMSLKHSVMSW